MKKRTVFLICIMLICRLAASDVYAQNNQAFLEQVYQEDDHTLDILCAIPGEKGSKENFDVSLDGSSLAVDSVTTLRKEPVPMTIYCLADISGSMKGRMDQVKDTLYTLGNGLKDEDNIIIGKMGNKITDSELMSEQKEIYAQIESLRPTGEDTDLYGGIIHGLDYLLQEPEVHTMKVLVVLSDGFDDQGDGTTYREVYDRVEKADIPVFTVAPILSADDYENAKALGSFARNSPGGIYLPGSDEGRAEPTVMTGKEMGLEILKELGKTFHVKVSLEGFPNDGDTNSLRLSVSFRSGTGKLYRDSRELWKEELRLADTAEEPDKEPALALEPEPEPDSKPDSKREDKWGLLLCVCFAVLAAAFMIGGLVLLIQAKKRREEKEHLQGKEKNIHPKASDIHIGAEGLEKQRDVPRLAVRLSAIGQKEKSRVIELAKEYEVTVGRNNKAQFVLDARDSKLSGIHFVMYWNGSNVYVWDSQSKNGTSVNGVVINELGRVAVRSGDSLRAGNYEYRLYWEER